MAAVMVPSWRKALANDPAVLVGVPVAAASHNRIGRLSLPPGELQLISDFIV